MAISSDLERNNRDRYISWLTSRSTRRLWLVFVIVLVFHGFFDVSQFDLDNASHQVVTEGMNFTINERISNYTKGNVTIDNGINTFYHTALENEATIDTAKDISNIANGTMPTIAHGKNTFNNTKFDDEADWIRSNMSPRQARTIAAFYQLDYDTFNLTQPSWFFRSTWDGLGADTPDYSVDYNTTKLRQEDDAICRARGECEKDKHTYWSGELECYVCSIYKVMSTSLPHIINKSSVFPEPLNVTFLNTSLPIQFARLTNQTLTNEEKTSLINRIIQYQRNTTHHVTVVRDPVFRFGSIFRWLCRWTNWECKIGPTTNFTHFYQWFFEEANLRPYFHHAKPQTYFCRLFEESVRSEFKVFHYSKSDIGERLKDYVEVREGELKLRYESVARRPHDKEEMIAYLLEEVIGLNSNLH